MIKFCAKYLIFEAIIIFLYVFSINNYIGKVDTTINADAIGYYDYLPSLFIHRDFDRKDLGRTDFPEQYTRINQPGIYVEYGDFLVNKYPCGTAILQAPFFAIRYWSLADSKEITGYDPPFQKSIFYAAVFYLFLCIFLLKKILQLYDVKNWVIFLSQFLLVFATSLVHYANTDAGFSHVYSAFAILLFLYLIKLFLVNGKLKHFLWACATLGLIFLLRNPNILIVFFIPFVAGSKNALLEGFKLLLKNKLHLASGILLFAGVVSIQLIAWYMQTGNFVVYSYQGEGFTYLFSPKIYDILFSYKKGLFVYTPFAFIASLTLFWFAFKKDWFMFVSWLLFFTLLTYVLSSWHSWYYGCSFGLRAYVDFYVIFLIPFALFMQHAGLWWRILVLTLSLVTIPINMIQTLQYKEYILHWIDMDKDKYWKVFLKTDDRYKGLIWKSSDTEGREFQEEINLGDFLVEQNQSREICSLPSSEIEHFENIDLIQIGLDDEFKDTENARVSLKIVNDSTSHVYYIHQPYLLLFQETKLNQWQSGAYNYRFDPITDQHQKSIVVELLTDDSDKNFRNVKLRFFRKKW